jgi:hypothetical protein
MLVFKEIELILLVCGSHGVDIPVEIVQTVGRNERDDNGDRSVGGRRLPCAA